MTAREAFNKLFGDMYLSASDTAFTVFEYGYKAGSADENEACAKVCDEKAKRNFNWGSENADRYHAQADWAEHCAEAIRARMK